jgi:hypothetical protein
MTFETSFIANREVRFIPAGWQHPKDGRDRYVPLLPTGYCAANGLTEEERNGVGEMPDTSGLSPESLEIAAYETTTEGTPISPAFPNTPEGRLAVANWCAEHETTYGDFKADAEAWAAMLFTDHVVLVDGSDGSIRIP